MRIDPDTMMHDGGGYDKPATSNAIAALQAAADKAATDAANNWGNGPDARYDQRIARETAAALQAALDDLEPEVLYGGSTDDRIAEEIKQEEEKPIVTTTNTNTGTNTSVSPTPPTTPNPPTPPTPPVKTATPQYVLFNDDEIPVDAMVDLLFENIGGQELLTIARADTVNGQKVLYQPIKNLGILKDQYNPNNIIRLQNTSDKFFSNFSIKLSDKIPVVGNGSNGSNVYLDSSGNLVIEFINLENDEQAEIEITSSGIIIEVGI